MGEGGRIFVVSPESKTLEVVATNSATGGLGSVQTVSLGSGWRPSDVKAALGPADEVTGLREELVVVVGFDQIAGRGEADPATGTVWTMNPTIGTISDQKARVEAGGVLRRLGIQREEP